MPRLFGALILSVLVGLCGGSLFLLLTRALLTATIPVVGSYTAPAYPLLVSLLSFGGGALFCGVGEGLGKFPAASPAFRQRVLTITLGFLLFSIIFWSFLGYANGRQGQVGRETTQIRQIRREIQEKTITPEVKANKEQELTRLEQQLLGKAEDGRSSFLAWLWAQNALLSLFPLAGLIGGMALLRHRIAKNLID
jgi:hypothetical protein